MELNKKNIFIGGVARAGKSTIAEIISKNNIYNHIPVDYIATSFKENFPNCKINNRVIIDDGSINLSLFLSTIIKHIEKNNEKFVLDSAHVMPHDIIKYLNKEKWDIYFVGYPNIKPKTKLDIIRKSDSDTSWTRNYSDKEMLELVNGLIEISKKIEKECQEYNIRFIDTSKNFNETINAVVKDIVIKLEE